jgi:M3 family oligoendopeptidase
MPTIPFDDLQVETPQVEAVQARTRALRAAFDGAPDAAGRLRALEDWDALRRELSTWHALVGLRFRQDTRDAGRRQALEQRDEVWPKFQELEVGFQRALLDGPHATELAGRFGSHLLDVWRTMVDSYDPVIEQESVVEAKGCAAYTELTSSARFDFRGESLNLSQLRKYSQHPERDVRHEASRLQWAWFADHADELDRLYSELVDVRTRQARKLGHEDFVPLAYRKLGRTDYGPDDVARYRDAIREHVVPLCTRLRERQRRTLGVDTLRVWDEGVQDPRGAPKPKGGSDWMLAQARAMFDELGHGLGRFFGLMADGHYLDLEAREGKAGGGFCTSFPTLGMPFIFANFNGTKGDVEVFTHETGHAFQNYSSRGQPLLDYHWPTAEAAEVHSMSLEYLTWPWMERFFGDDAERYRRTHLTESLLFLPYGVAVDDFQHRVYRNPGASAAERLAMWREVESLYLPHRNWGDLARPAAGGMWQLQLHVYLYPFYYIDYTLAGVCALQFWVRARQDREAAMEAYAALCRRGGEAPFQDLVRSAGLRSPFDPGCLEEVVAAAEDALAEAPV